MSDKSFLAKMAVFTLILVNLGLYYVFWPTNGSGSAQETIQPTNQAKKDNPTTRPAQTSDKPIPIPEPPPLPAAFREKDFPILLPAPTFPDLLNEKTQNPKLSIEGLNPLPPLANLPIAPTITQTSGNDKANAIPLPRIPPISKGAGLDAPEKFAALPIFEVPPSPMPLIPGSSIVPPGSPPPMPNGELTPLPPPGLDLPAISNTPALRNDATQQNELLVPPIPGGLESKAPRFEAKPIAKGVEMAPSPWGFSMEIVGGRTLLTARVHKKTEFKILCDRIEVKAPDGDVMALGQVEIFGPGMHAKCGRLILPLREDRLQLEGNVEINVQERGMAGASMMVQAAALTFRAEAPAASMEPRVEPKIEPKNGLKK